MMYTLFDNVFNLTTKCLIEEYAKRIDRYALGWSDKQGSNLLYIHSTLYKNDMDNMKFFSSIKNPGLIEKIAGRDPINVVMNVSFPGYYYSPHVHEGQQSLVYYVNTEWKAEWSGETLIYDDDGIDITACIPFSPGKVLWLETDVVHSMRPPSLQAPFYRFSISMFFK